MTVYLGKKPVGVTKIVKKEVAKTKFGASVDTFLGDVDENGVYTPPTEPFTLDLTGIKTVATGGFYGRFSSGTTGEVKKIIANDLRTAYADAFRNAFEYQDIEEATFGVEELSANNVFRSAFLSGRCDGVCFFNLKKVSGQSVFEQVFFNAGQTDLDKAFPVLEEISGRNAFNGFVSYVANRIYSFSSVKKIIGGASTSQAAVGSYYFKNIIWHLPRATELSGYVWNVGATYTGEIHFAAANQAALEACDGYANKWGNAGATIYFDLMLSITVDGVVYSRKHTIGGYTSWESDSGGIVYTDATAEPATGTVVYSDQGTTQVGTVSEVA